VVTPKLSMPEMDALTFPRRLKLPSRNLTRLKSFARQVDFTGTGRRAAQAGFG